MGLEGKLFELLEDDGIGATVELYDFVGTAETEFNQIWALCKNIERAFQYLPCLGIPKIEWLEDRTRGLSLVSCGADGMGIIHCRLEEKDLTFVCRLCEAMGHEARQRSLRRHSHRQICLICWLVLVGGHLPRGESPSFVRDDDIFQTDGI